MAPDPVYNSQTPHELSARLYPCAAAREPAYSCWRINICSLPSHPGSLPSGEGEDRRSDLGMGSLDHWFKGSGPWEGVGEGGLTAGRGWVMDAAPAKGF